MRAKVIAKHKTFASELVSLRHIQMDEGYANSMALQLAPILAGRFTRLVLQPLRSPKPPVVGVGTNVTNTPARRQGHQGGVQAFETSCATTVRLQDTPLTRSNTARRLAKISSLQPFRQVVYAKVGEVSMGTTGGTSATVAPTLRLSMSILLPAGATPRTKLRPSTRRHLLHHRRLNFSATMLDRSLEAQASTCLCQLRMLTCKLQLMHSTLHSGVRLYQFVTCGET